MGSWAVGNLDNDDALDWLQKFHQSGGDAAVIRAAFERALEPNESLSEHPVLHALAAAEMIACRNGHPGPGKRCAGVAEWVRGRLEITPELISLAREALAAAKARWSRKEFWTGMRTERDQSAWLACITDLENRLA